MTREGVQNNGVKNVISILTERNADLDAIALIIDALQPTERRLRQSLPQSYIPLRYGSDRRGIACNQRVWGEVSRPTHHFRNEFSGLFKQRQQTRQIMHIRKVDTVHYQPSLDSLLRCLLSLEAQIL